MMLLSLGAFAQCAGFESATVSPMPINGTYAPSTTVTFCYTMDGYNQVGSNWIDGFDLTLGPGWDLSTLTPILSPNSCDGLGAWGWYNSVTSTNTGQIFGPGFFYDANLDGNPGNDYGDYTVTGTCQWNFCFSITSASTCNGQDLSAFVTATGDGTSGSWFNQSCPGVIFSLVQATCAFACNIDLTYILSDPTCYGACNGSIVIQPDSGVAPFVSIWSSSNGNNLCDGSYSVTTTDANGCSFDTTLTLVQPDSIWATLTFDSLLCNGDLTGSATLVPQGGTPPYIVAWSNGDIGLSTTGLPGGSYIVSMTDASFCPQLPPFFMNNWQMPFVIYEPSELIDGIAAQNESCDSANNGVVSVQAYGGTSPWSYDWGTLDSLYNLDAGMYSVVITDANGCTVSDSIQVSTDPSIYFEACCDTTIYNGESVVLFSSFINGYNYNWSNGDNIYYSVVSPETTTTYYVWCDGGYGCYYLDSVVVMVRPTDYFYIPNAFSPDGDGINDSFFPIIGDITKINSFKIYNRWGELIYNDNINHNWNGRYKDEYCSMGVYAYYVNYSIYNSQFVKKGNVTLIK